MIHFAFVALLISNFLAADNVDAKQDLELMQGDWVIATAELSGKPMPEDVTKTIKLTIEGDKYIVSTPSGADKGVCALNSEVSPKTLEITGVEGPNKGKKIPAIYEIKEGELKVCYDLSGKEFPKEFKSTDGTLLFLVTYTKVKK
jgi:uncharacterized protein (TIGR03067 family)